MLKREKLSIPTTLMLQGKLVSQLVAFIWRYCDADTDEVKNKCALILKYCFERTISDLSLISSISEFKLDDILEKQNKIREEKGEKQETDERVYGYTLEKLLTFDVENYLCKDDGDKLKESQENKIIAELLSTVFGSDRIRTLTNYLSPIFKQDEVDLSSNDKSSIPVYKFFVDQNSFVGTLKDPDLEYRLGFRYMISYPPRPILSEATLTTKDLDAWIDNKNDDVYRPSNPFIPVTTS